MERSLLDLYSDYLLVSTKKATATGLSELVDGAISHDQITRFLSGEALDGKALWLQVKKLVRQYESENACLIFDDTIVEKAYMDENEIICWHWDHSKGRSVKGMNILTAFYTSENEGEIIHTPLTYQIIAKSKSETEIDSPTNQARRVSPVTKNEMMREMITGQIRGQVKFSYILADSWFASNENMKFIRKRRKTFLFEVKDNRLIVTDKQERDKGHFIRIDQAILPDGAPIQVWLKDLEFPVVLFKQVFKNKDLSTGVRYLVTNDLTMRAEQFKTLYKKRWSVEVYHESIKQNTSIGSSPARKVRTQSNHVFAALFAYVKLEMIKLAKGINHFALKAKIYMTALKTSMYTLAAMH